MSQALYRKYRSRSLDEIVGQKPIVTALKNSLQSGEISHAYLFTGPRGVGKTSIARIFAFQINNLPYDNNLPLDIIEIDAASNRRIDEIRSLREKVAIAPVSAKYKVYIIDEVHMLTKEAFNALLKTLEEPPEHVIFILATTESHKLPETIISRTQQYNFKLAEPGEVVDHLGKISKNEKIDITTDALKTLADHSGGSLRDALSLLDQVRHSGGKQITNQQIEKVLGLPPESLITEILENIKSNDVASLVNTLKEASDNGISASLLAESLSKTLQEQLIANQLSLPKKVVIELMKNLVTIDASPRPNIQLEIDLLQALFDSHPENVVQSSQSYSPPLTISATPGKVKKILAEPTVKSTTAESKPTELQKTKEQPIVSQQMNTSLWHQVLEDLRQTHNTLYSVLRMAKLNQEKLSENIIELEFGFPFHQKRMADHKNQQPLHDSMEKLGVSGYEILCSLSPNNLKKEPVLASNLSNDNQNFMLDQVKNIFGGAEVLE